MKDKEDKVERRVLYKPGDLVKVSFSENPWYTFDESLFAEEEGYGLVIAQTNSWYEAYKDFVKCSDPDTVS